MTVPKPPKLIVVDAPGTNPLPEPQVALQRLTHITHELGAAFGGLKTAIRPIKGDLDVEITRLESLRKQQPPLWESKMLLKGCDAAVSAVSLFLGTLEQARTLRDDLGPLLDLAEQHVEVRRDEATVAADIDGLELYVAQLKRAKRAFTELAGFLTETEQWEAIARVATGRLFRATQRVVQDYELLRIQAALESLKAQVQRLKTAESPVAPDLTRLHGLVEQIVGQPLPLMTITWPESNNPLAGPTLA
jgi:hypothetical protein